MERTKLKKNRNSYSHTASCCGVSPWNGYPPRQIQQKNIGYGRSNNFFSMTKRAQSQGWSQSVRGPDPTAPHLKYGVFPRRPPVTRPQMAWSQSFATYRRPDPTQPHLKYGVFPNRRTASSRVLPKSLPIKPIPTFYHRQGALEMPKNQTNKKKSVQKGRKAQLAGAPVVVYHTDKRHLNLLSLSEIMHLDIKPKIWVRSAPSYCPSTNFRTYRTGSPRMCRSPV